MVATRRTRRPTIRHFLCLGPASPIPSNRDNRCCGASQPNHASEAARWSCIAGCATDLRHGVSKRLDADALATDVANQILGQGGHGTYPPKSCSADDSHTRDEARATPEAMAPPFKADFKEFCECADEVGKSSRKGVPKTLPGTFPASMTPNKPEFKDCCQCAD